MARIERSKANGFARVNGGERRYRDIASITGEVGAGKTYYTLTAPDPIVVFNLDKGLEGVADKEEFADKEIYEHVIDWSPGGMDESEYEVKAFELKKEFQAKLAEAVGFARTIVIDTESRLWQIYRYSHFGGPNSGNLKDYDRLNQEFEDIINVVKSSNCNLFLIRSMKDDWDMNGKAWHVKGRKVWGYEHLSGLLMTELFFRLDDSVPVDPDNEDPNYRYVIDVGKCRHRLDLQHTTIPRMTFPQFGRLMIPGSKTSNWS